MQLPPGFQLQLPLRPSVPRLLTPPPTARQALRAGLTGPTGTPVTPSQTSGPGTASTRGQAGTTSATPATGPSTTPSPTTAGATTRPSFAQTLAQASQRRQ